LDREEGTVTWGWVEKGVGRGRRLGVVREEETGTWGWMRGVRRRGDGEMDGCRGDGVMDGWRERRGEVRRGVVVVV
jgi:hypothetical protein